MNLLVFLPLLCSSIIKAIPSHATATTGEDIITDTYAVIRKLDANLRTHTTTTWSSALSSTIKDLRDIPNSKAYTEAFPGIGSGPRSGGNADTCVAGTSPDIPQDRVQERALKALDNSGSEAISRIIAGTNWVASDVTASAHCGLWQEDARVPVFTSDVSAVELPTPLSCARYPPVAAFYTPKAASETAWIGSNTATRTGLPESRFAAGYAAGLGAHLQRLFDLPTNAALGAKI
ncbi:hypothetical protein HOY82DRAFT_595360 [Tuber indicum]|nr:hypothetical protein HOY82DRAFT_595360 [Tuber indicum]